MSIVPETDSDTVSPDSSSHDPVERTRWIVVVTLALATLVVASELTMSAFALPSISSDLGVSSSATAWVLTAYTLPLVAMGVAAGRWMDRADAGLVFLLTLVVAAIASVISAVAPNFEVLILSRVLQGMSAALFMGLYMPLISATVRITQRGKAIGVIGTIMMLGAIGLAPVGGLVAEAVGWRAVFLVKMPLLLVVFWMGYRVVPRQRPARETGVSRLPVPDRGFFRESLWLGTAMAALLLAIEIIENQPAQAAGLLLASAVLIYRWARLESAASVVRLLSYPRFGLPALALTLVAATIGLSAFTLPFYVSEVLHETADVLAWAIIGFVGVSALLSPVAGIMADRFGALFVAMIGSAMTLAGVLTLATLDANSSTLDLVLCCAAAGGGVAVFNAPIMTTLLNAAPDDQSGSASGLAGVTRMLGSTIGPAVAAMGWSLNGGGEAGLRASVFALSALVFVAFLALLVAHRSPLQPALSEA